MEFVSRAGQKLEHAIKEFKLNITNFTCVDLGSNTGGFVHCLLHHGASKVYSVETGYGVLDWNLRNDSRVVVLERTNAMHVVIPEKADLVTIDTSWTSQKNILPNVKNFLKEKGLVISLIKLHYEATAKKELKSHLVKGRLPESQHTAVLNSVFEDIKNQGFMIIHTIKSPIKGGKAQNTEYLVLLELP